MKIRFSFILLIILTSTLVAKSQYVSIPDTNFRNVLKATLPTSSCINGDLLDTICSSKLSLDYYWISKNIKDLTGIQYFKMMTGLEVDNNSLTSLPPLTNSISSLYCNQNQLTHLPTLPGSLRTLSCGYNLLTSLPDFPDTLVYLNCAQNRLTSLPSFPKTLSTVHCEQNQLTSLPTIPGSLGYLNCNKNQLTALPSLPNTLVTLICSQNQLTSLPILPASLGYITCTNNKLNSLPALPSNLKKLWCDSNQLTFEDIVPVIHVSDIIYAPQDSVDNSTHQTSKVGSSFQLTTSATYIGNQYQWVKDGKTINASPNFLGANTPTLSINNITLADSGAYSCQITNPAAPLLTLNRRTINLKIIETPTNSDPLPEIKIYELISPNNDNDNDYFTILNIEKYKNIEVAISNTWGATVFHKQYYQNDWSGDELGDGTYYYNVRVHDTNKTYKGRLIIKR